MSISVITPHFNDLDGLKRIYGCLEIQTSRNWEWLIVDDFSERTLVCEIENWVEELGDKRIQIIFNSVKTNASVCRNKGADLALFDHLVFLDADDYISEIFIAQRNVECHEFVIFKNKAVVDSNGIQLIYPDWKGNYLDCFLNAKFIWQTTAILWNKSFFMKIGKFDPNLKRLQDVELSIRALFSGTRETVIDNEIDFFYCAKPIRLKPDIVRQSCDSVNYLITKLGTDYSLNVHRQTLVKAYYFACVKGLQRCKNRADVVHVKETLDLFRKKKYINVLEYRVGNVLLKLYRNELISDSLFLRTNRYFFK
ncbi:glycosyltransferase family 2 protein [Bizionia psychrotolerans]|uniref:glycosyltransferase family 2 protein n=1 Tax=Bizionia psychrotolerans TaxID=1492901 RepID=UPI000650DAE2|nr:glycosyltransferase family A protein [Bizionia psychrotolerans]